MQVSLVWTSTPGAFMLWAQILFAWFVIQYLLTSDAMNTAPDPAEPSRSEAMHARAGASRIGRIYSRIQRELDPKRHYHRQASARVASLAGIVGILCGISAASIPLILATAALAATLLFGRRRAGSGYGLIGWEIGVNVVFGALAGFLIGGSRLTISHVWILLPIAEERLACLFLIAAGLIYLGKGGTYIVRGFLAVAGTMPRFEGEKKHPLKGSMELRYNGERDIWLLSAEQVTAEPSEVGTIAEEPDRAEFKRGRLIGNMERLVLALLAAVGSYPAIGFLIAAKGLVRSKEFENRDYAEYFLVGTLASTTLALAVGTALRLMVNQTWK